MQIYKTKYFNKSKEPIFLGDILVDTERASKYIVVFHKEHGEALENLITEEQIKLTDDIAVECETIERIENGPLGQ